MKKREGERGRGREGRTDRQRERDGEREEIMVQAL